MSTPSLADAHFRVETGHFPAFNCDAAGESLGKQHLLRKCGLSISTKPLPLDRHRHAGFELHYIEKGRLTFEYEGGQFDLRGGSACIMQPGLLHWGRNDIIPPARLFWLVVNPQVIYPGYHPGEQQQLARRLGTLGNRSVAQLHQGDQHFSLVSQAFELAVGQPEDAMVMAHLRFACLSFLHAMIDGLTAESYQGAEQEIEGKIDSHPAIDRVIAFLHHNVVNDVAVNQLAEIAGKSLSRFHELFRHQLGTSPAQYHAALRIQHAQQLLADEPECAVLEVACRCGYSSGQQFATAFKKYTGVSPSQYRREVQRYE